MALLNANISLSSPLFVSKGNSRSWKCARNNIHSSKTDLWNRTACKAEETKNAQDAEFQHSRRAALGFLLATSTAFSSGCLFPNSSSAEEFAVKTSVAEDLINAYEFDLPLSIIGTDIPLNWAETRKPERYSSAAPLSPDAKQRIVAERLEFKNNLVLTVTVGPPNEIFVPGSNPNDWSALNVAKSVLADKSTNRLSPEQRLKEIEIGETEKIEIDGIPYWRFEHLIQKSPTFQDASNDVYRHFLSVAAFREGYFYTLSISTLQQSFDKLEPVLQSTVKSFRFTPPSSDFVPPWKDPWRFW